MLSDPATLAILDADLQNIMADLFEQVEWFTGGVSQGLFTGSGGLLGKL